MLCHRITVENFRNIERADVEFSPGVNLLIGNNAQGKTNLLEAIALPALGKSFRGAADGDMIGFEKDFAKIHLTYSDTEREQTLTTTLIRGKKRKTEQNGLPVPRLSEIVGQFRVVIFTPEHLSLIKSGPELRRNFLDIALSQLRPMYISSLLRYGKILKERNMLIKNAAESDEGRKNFLNTVDLWSAQLAHEAAVIASYRARYIRQMRASAAEVFEDMTDGHEIPIFRYIGSSGQEEDEYSDIPKTEQRYLELLSGSHEREIGAGFTLWGTHRDDIGIELNGAPARLFASQGQQRSLALAMKLAEGEISRMCFGDDPVYLFDDVLSELDPHRREYLTGKISDRQVIMTGCEPTRSERLSSARMISVRNGMFFAEE